MSHVDDGALHAYLDGELPALEAHDLEAHLAQCRECRSRLEEERALIARADELLGLAAPPDRAIPPFRPGDREPPVRLWWRLRIPLAWAATVLLALGTGLYLGSAVTSRKPPAAKQSATDLAARIAPTPPAAVESAAAQHAAPRPARRAPSAQPAVPPSVTVNGQRADEVGVAAAPAVRDRPETSVVLANRGEPAARAFKRLEAPAPAPAPALAVSGVAPLYIRTGAAITLDSARALLGTDPFAVPGLPIRGIYRGRMIGYSALVVVAQALDSSTLIDVVTGQTSPVSLEAVVVSGAAQPDTHRPAERALLGRAPAAADSLAARERKAEARLQMRGAAAPRPATGLVFEVRGPLAADSLAALQRRLQPLRP